MKDYIIAAGGLAAVIASAIIVGTVATANANGRESPQAGTLEAGAPNTVSNAADHGGVPAANASEGDEGDEISLEEARRRLDLIPAKEDEPFIDDALQEPWFVVLGGGRGCVPINFMFEASEPSDIAALFADAGKSLSIVEESPSKVMMREGEGYNARFFAFVRGENLCEMMSRLSYSAAAGGR